MIGWQELALDPPRRVEPAAGRARLRERFEDFQVDEVLGFEPSGQGEHWLLRVRKCNANTGWVAADLARPTPKRAEDASKTAPGLPHEQRVSNAQRALGRDDEHSNNAWPRR